MRSFLILIAAFLTVASNSQSVDSLFIYSGGERISIPVDTTRVLIDWQTSVDTANIEEVLSDIVNLDVTSYTRDVINGFFLHRLSGGYNFDTVLQELRSDSRTRRVVSFPLR